MQLLQPSLAREWTCPKCGGDALYCECYLLALARHAPLCADCGNHHAGIACEMPTETKRGIRLRDDDV